MSDLLSAQLLREMNENLSDSEDDHSISVIDVKYMIIPGLREGSNLIWAFEEEYLYYKNAFSESKNELSCKCYVAGCRARLKIRADGTAYRDPGIPHARNHGSMYTNFKYMHCFNAMKEKAKTAPASMTTYDVYTEVLLE